MNILVQGWFNIPHSYSIVSCFNLIWLHKKYPNINLFIEEMPYFSSNWAPKELTYGPTYNNLIKSLKPYDRSIKIDLVYRIIYPYDIRIDNTMPHTIDNKLIPICVFYTSEFRNIDHTYFTLPAKKENPEDYITKYLKTFKNIYFTSPSVWSSKGMERYNVPENRNRIITHGIDPTIFYYDDSKRSEIRTKYNIKEDDVVLVNIGACTGNKGISLLIQMLNILVNKANRKEFKLFLKGISDLYASKNMYICYLQELCGFIEQKDLENLINNHIIFTDSTLTFEELRHLYNACDVYISPYLAEGFNLTPLEALACGMKVILPISGSTEQYANDIKKNGGEEFVHFIDSKVVENRTDLNFIKYQNEINAPHFLKVLMETDFKRKIDNTEMLKYIANNYSWEKVSTLLYEYFEYIIRDQ